MTIYINGRFLTQPMTGVERYAYNICKAMARIQQPFTIVCPKATIHPDYDANDLTVVHYGIGNSHFWEQCVLPFFFLGKKNYILFSFTGLGSILIRHKVMTIHDLSFLANPSWFSKAYFWWYKLMTPLAVRTSLQIITVSEFSKKEILRYYPFVKEEFIHVVYNAVYKDKFYPLPEHPAPTERFALAVSSIDPRKNFYRLVQAFENIKDCKLYIVGKTNRVFNQCKGMVEEMSNVKYLGRVSDEELLKLYNQAVCFIFPSLYEGFGLPTLEAMACGCPVLLSDIEVHREVCANAGVYFNPQNVDNIRNTIEQFLKEDDTFRSSLIAKGYENMKRFSWGNSAQAVINLVRYKHNI
jgi:glycosyltransferase involved in cell wall biosynthesis